MADFDVAHLREQGVDLVIIPLIAPQPWHPFFQSLSWQTVVASVNRRLTCG